MTFNEDVDRANRVFDRHDAVEKAKAVGTFGADNRARQYSNLGPRELEKCLNDAWTKIRTCEKQLNVKDSRILDLEKKLRRSWKVNSALIFILVTFAEIAKALFLK